ncbi:alpha/beta hydrolase [Streptacidiphilus sp. PB12-B1b]|uniref:alpha/beta hydrolase fold domain-containing protein n=1 Tax=Streptacidiphilus sp. PB12-B1b TaxID=2705012 RepID=UPI0015FE08BE|nr:alpha/beta hydrolase fold domain-containing protein [Streptacidiphilus sp. PB12-B1b]QMU76829.1 alpha/beta hydrolase [Streptacidiphilus sp. PB12-B1b]
MSVPDPTLPTPTSSTATDRADYLASLLAALPADVRQRLQEIGAFSINEGNLAAMRQRTLRSPGTPSNAVEHTDRLVPAAPGDPDVPVRLHRAHDATTGLPCLVSIHGGGYVIGSHLGDDGRFDRWCTALTCVGVSVGYRLAPETPYPGPLEDCYAALAWVHRNAAELGVDPDRIGVIGGSAGGGLAAGLALLARDRGEIPVGFQVLSYPMLDDRLQTASGRAGAPLWDAATNQYGWQAYLGGYGAGQAIPGYAVPARAHDLRGLPPAFVTVGNLDGLLDEDLDYARRLIAAGVPTDLHVFADGPHAFDSMLSDTAVAGRARRVLEDWLHARMHPGARPGAE